MGNCLGDLRLRQPVIHADRDVPRQLCDLTVGNERTDGDEAAVAGREVGT